MTTTDTLPPIPIYHDPNQLPPGGGGFVVPHQATFNTMFGNVLNQYSGLFDEAAADSAANSYAMTLDPAISEPMNTRKRAISLLPWHFEAFDPDDPKQVEAAARNEKLAKSYMRLPELIYNLADADFIGREGAQVLWGWDKYGSPGERVRSKPIDHIPIHGDKLVFQYDGTVGIRVGSTFRGSRTTLTSGSPGLAHFLSPSEREAVIIHRFAREDAPFQKGQLAGAREGHALRQQLYWFWAQKNMYSGLLADYMRWFAQGLIVVYYEMSSTTGLEEAKARVDRQSGSPYLFWPMDMNAQNKIPPVQVVNPQSASTGFLTDIIENTYNTQIRRAILGQTQTTVSTPLGIGSGQPELQAETFAGVVKFSSTIMAATLTTDFIEPMYRYNEPGMPPARWVFDIDSPNAADFIEAADWFISKGGSVDMDTARGELGLPPEKPGKPLLGGPMPNQPAAVSALPQDVPVVDPGTTSGTTGAVPTGDTAVG